MCDNSLETRELYRLIGIRHDGTHAVIKSGMTHDEARLTAEVVEHAEIFASLPIEPDAE